MAGFIAVGYFLISLSLGLILFCLWLRIALRYLRVSSLHPLNTLIYSITNPLIKPIHVLTRYKYSPGQKYDWPALFAIVVLEFLKIILLSLLYLHTTLGFLWTITYVLADLIIQPCNLLFYAVLIRVIMSYANPGWQHPFADIFRLLTQPLLILGRKIIPDISGFDFSPMVIMILLKIITLFINANLPLNLL